MRVAQEGLSDFPKVTQQVSVSTRQEPSSVWLLTMMLHYLSHLQAASVLGATRKYSLPAPMWESLGLWSGLTSQS